jgi:hypothetical protein
VRAAVEYCGHRGIALGEAADVSTVAAATEVKIQRFGRGVRPALAPTVPRKSACAVRRD